MVIIQSLVIKRLLQGGARDDVVIQTDTAGGVLWQHAQVVTGKDIYSDELLTTSDNGFLITGFQETNSTHTALVQKLDSLGNIDWTWSSTPIPFGSNTEKPYLSGLTELDDGNFIFVGTAIYYINNVRLSTIYFVKLSPSGQLLMERTINLGTSGGAGINIYEGIATPFNGNVIFGREGPHLFLMLVDSIGSLFNNRIVGHYYKDANSNCLRDSGEVEVSNQIVVIDGLTRSYYVSTDSTGSYSMEVDTGYYTINPTSISPYWQICQNQPNVTFTTPYEQDTVDIALQPVDSCAYLEVDISAPFLRRCFPSTYHISYQNLGTVEAPNAYVEVTLDPYLTYTSSSIPLIQQNGPIYRFDVGSIPSFGSGSFALEVLVDCDSTALGQVHCTEAHIYPDTLCTGGTWTGPIIRASAICTTDSMTFRLQNVGNGMVSAQNYVIIEEHVMIHQAPYQLGGGMDTLITIPIQRGKFYRIEANQANGFPSYLGNSTVVATNLDCGGLVLLNTPDILGQYYNGNVSPFIAVDCQANRGAYDPNDKNAQPRGYQASHYISNNIPLNYHIRFQNTGTDTAFTVVVVDTLDSHLDLSTLSMGASSHPYTWQLNGNNILTVTFSNIMLPDSNVNEPLSHGFFKFEIDQLPNHPDGTLLYNSAAIYFDFNPPIITNEVFHTIGSNFVVVQTININYLKPEYFSVRVFPNPFQQSATFKVESDQVYEALDLQVFNATGQLVQQYQEHSTDRLQMQRRNLPTGIYFYRLSGDQQLLSTGKVVLK